MSRPTRTSPGLLDRRVPFGSGFAPWLDAARRTLRSPAAAPALGPALVEHLAARLGAVFGPALLELYREVPTWSYERFVAAVPALVHAELPGAAELLDTTTHHWIEATSTLVTRLDAAVARWWPGCTVTDVRTGLGDPHDGGHTTARVILDDGRSWAYKPRPLAAEVRFWELVAHHGDLFADVTSPRVLEGTDHGFVEWVEPSPVLDAAAYWRGAGRMLALVHLVGAGDLHAENTVCTGTTLLPVDLEVIASPEVRAPAAPDSAFVLDSAVATGMLPDLPGPGGVVEEGSLFARGGRPLHRRRRWVALGTDEIALRSGRAVSAHRANEPRDIGGAVIAFDADALVGGYEAATVALGTAPDPSHAFDDVATRWVVRRTADYVTRQRAACSRAVLADTRAIRQALERLPARDELWDAMPPLLADAIEDAERRAQLRLDVPRLSVIGDRVQGEGATLGRLPMSGVDRVRERHARWRDPVRRADDAAVVRIVTGHHDAVRPARSTPPGSFDVRTEVAAVASSILHRAREGGRHGWITIEPIGVTGRPWPRADAVDLYNGGAGIAVFLAAAAPALGDSTPADAAIAWVDAHRDDTLARVEEPWFATGSAGVAWAVAAIGRSLGRADVVSLAGRLITSSLDGASRRMTTGADDLELFDGWAGVLTAAVDVLGVLEASADPEATASAAVIRVHLELATDAFVARLDADARDSRRRVRVQRPGLAHGSFGITLALARLGRALGHVDAAARHENNVASEEARVARQGGLAGFRRQPSDRPLGWCRGAAGYLLARAPGDITPDGSMRKHIAAARAAVAAPGAVSQLCCGTAGQAAAVLAHDQSSEAARAMLGASVRRPLLEAGRRLWSPSLFRGAAGLGLVALAMDDPTTPCPLTISIDGR